MSGIAFEAEFSPAYLNCFILCSSPSCLREMLGNSWPLDWLLTLLDSYWFIEEWDLLCWSWDLMESRLEWYKVTLSIEGNRENC